MKDREDWGPAYPLSRPELCSHDKVEGMSLRDYFAGQALAGILAAGNGVNVDGERVPISEGSYALADEMIKERNK